MRKVILVLSASILLGIAFASTLLFHQSVAILNYYSPEYTFSVMVVSIAVSAILGIITMNAIGNK